MSEAPLRNCWAKDEAALHSNGSMEMENIDTYMGAEQWGANDQEVWNNLWYLQYDRMFGEKYSVRE